MNEDDVEDSVPAMSVDSEIKELMGLFDVPAFARRGQDLEYSLKRIHARCLREREESLEMVRLRLRQWSRVATGPGDWSEVFAGPIDSLWQHAQHEPPVWAGRVAPARQKRTVARDLIASVQRFNVKWRRFLESLDLGPTNQVIDQYNKYYVLEKECVMGSARLASRHFTPVPHLSPEVLLRDYPMLPVPELLAL
ncbi:MAG: hypothetical protein WBX00_08945 [Isosphaeraceae bacterium]